MKEKKRKETIKNDEIEKLKIMGFYDVTCVVPSNMWNAYALLDVRVLIGPLF